jgi:hypothetical protein
MYRASCFRGGDYFGDSGFLVHSVSLMTATTTRARGLFVLSSDHHFLQVLKEHPYFSQVLATARIAVNQKKTEFAADWFDSTDNEEDIESSDSDDDDSESEDDEGERTTSRTGTIMSEYIQLRRGSLQLKRALHGSSKETMYVWEKFAFFTEMLVPKEP